jgi:D-aminopeptidase
MTRARLRDLGIVIGTLPPGEYNAITDVPGVLVGHSTLIHDRPRVTRTGVTAIVPREGRIWSDNCHAAFHSFNGCGEMTGMHWLAESGLLCYPILLTTTHHVGTVHEAMVAYGQQRKLTALFSLGVVGETWDGWLNDLDGFPIQHHHVHEALDNARSGPVPEGNVGGGTGMICHGFKGGIGTSSRVIELAGESYTLGALVQANHGDRADLRIAGTPVGEMIGPSQVPLPRDDESSGGSILVVIATDAPLLPGQCRRLAQRAAVGFARVGGIGHNGSGDLFLAFSTGNHLPAEAQAPFELTYLPNHLMNPLFSAVAEAVEEAILNALTAADTMTGREGRTVYALPLEVCKTLVKPRLRPDQA